MKKNVIRLFKHLTLLLLLFSVAYSCSDDSLSEFEIRKMIEEEIRKNNQDLEITQWEILNFEVEKSNWEWKNDSRRYEAIADLPELTEFIYESGAQIAYAFIEDSKLGEVQKTLPYRYKNNELISCDYHLGSSGTVAFYIKT